MKGKEIVDEYLRLSKAQGDIACTLCDMHRVRTNPEIETKGKNDIQIVKENKSDFEKDTRASTQILLDNFDTYDQDLLNLFDTEYGLPKPKTPDDWSNNRAKWEGDNE